MTAGGGGGCGVMCDVVGLKEDYRMNATRRPGAWSRAELELELEPKAFQPINQSSQNKVISLNMTLFLVVFNSLAFSEK
jgi:hypothetical protein